MLIIVIAVTDYVNAEKQLLFAQKTAAEGIELRLDYLNNLDIEDLRRLRTLCHLPVIFTLRKKSQGGFYAHNEEQRLATLLTLCDLHPDYLDIEYDTATEFVETLSQRHPQVKLISSYHNFEHTPRDLAAIFQSMQSPHFSIYKMATQANSSLDALQMLKFAQRINQQHRFTGICMGEDGQCTRILSPVINNYFHYVILEKSGNTAPGQLTLDELLTIYHFDRLSKNTEIYAVLGNPVHSSVGYILHNRSIRLLNKNAVYIRLRVTADELPQALTLCRRLPFAGFSVTMPLKEAIIPLLDKIDSSAQPIGAINTIVVRNGNYIGFNTDGMGAVQALAEVLPLNTQSIIIIGAGGAAKAIAFVARQQGAQLLIVNRTLAKAQKLAAELNCQAAELSPTFDFSKTSYTTLLNTLPESVYAEKNLQRLLQPQHLIPNQLAMDIVYKPKMTTFLQLVTQENYSCIPGFKMYIYQALGQIQHWFNPNEQCLAEIKEMMVGWFANSL